MRHPKPVEPLSSEERLAIARILGITSVSEDQIENASMGGVVWNQEKCEAHWKSMPVRTQCDLLMEWITLRCGATHDSRWGVYCLDGPAKDTWCQHTEGHRIETDERTARTVAILFSDRSALDGQRCHYEARELPR